MAKDWDVEIDEKADGVLGELEVRQELSCVERKDLLDRLELDDDAFLDDKVQAIGQLDDDLFVRDWKLNLPPNVEVTCAQLVTKALLVR